MANYKFDTSEFDKRMKKYVTDSMQKAKRGLELAGDYLLDKSLEQVPIGDTRRLARSGRNVVTPGKQLSRTIGYNTVYASRLHEHPEYNFRHDRNPGAKGKYLIDPLNENKRSIYDIIGKAVKV